MDTKCSDVWGLGCILYLLTYGHAPFQHIEDTVQKMEAIVSPAHPIDFPPTGVPHLKDIIKVRGCDFIGFVSLQAQ